MQNYSLLEQIEWCRSEMIRLSESYDMTDEAVVEASKKLDELLNQYQREIYPKGILVTK